MKKLIMKKLIIVLTIVFISLMAFGCTESELQKDIERQVDIGNNLVNNQPIPTDVNYSLERYNLIRRTYWVNGMREKAINLPCPVQKPLGYIVLFTDSGAVVGRFIVDGKVTCLNSFLTPNEAYQYIDSKVGRERIEIPDIDGAFGENQDGIFFFTVNGNYIEWNGKYIYSDIPFEISDPVLNVGGNN